MFKLSIDLQSFQFSNGIIQSNDTIRVSITTFPDGRKQSLTIDEKKLKNFHHFFYINVTNLTEKILFVIRKKNFVQNDPILASTIIFSNQFPKTIYDKNNKVLKNINLYEPVQNNQSLINNPHYKRKIIGLMQVQFSLLYPKKTYEKNITFKLYLNKNNRKKGHSKINFFNITENESVFLNSEYLLSN